MKYSKNIYPRFAVVAAVEAFGDICKTFVTENDGYWVVNFSDYSVEKSLLIREFGNYLIDIINLKE